MAKEIRLTGGGVSIVDDEDYASLSRFKWHMIKSHSSGPYATRVQETKGKRRRFLMHREIINAPYGLDVDHRDGDGLNNQKSNLRLATKSQNQCNRPKQRNNTSGYKGVAYYRRLDKWQAIIKANRKYVHIGYFENKLDAAQAYINTAYILHGEFCTGEV